MNLIDDSNLMEAATALAELRKTHLQALASAAPSCTPSGATPSTPVKTAAPSSASVVPVPPSSNKGTKFPMRMHALLSDATVNDVITWLPHGKSFVILRPDILATRVLPLYFSQDGGPKNEQRGVRYTSFTRKMNRWGFRQISHGPDSGAFYHELFKRDDPEACRGMVCAKSRKSKDAKSVSSSSTVSQTSGTSNINSKPVVVSAAVTVSTTGASRSSLPFKKRQSLSCCVDVRGIPRNVEMKSNNTSLLSTRVSSSESSVSASSKDSNSGVVQEKSYGTFTAQQLAHQAEATRTAKETLAYFFKQAKEAQGIPPPTPSFAPPSKVDLPASTPSVSLAAQRAAVASAKEALARNFHEQYKSFVLASLLKNSHMAMEARGMDVDSSSVSSSGSITTLPGPTQGLTTQVVQRTPVIHYVTAEPGTQAQNCEAAEAAKSALYEAYKKAISAYQ